MLPYPPFFAWWTWLANIVWIIVNVILGLDRQAISINYYMNSPDTETFQREKETIRLRAEKNLESLDSERFGRRFES